MNKPSRPPIGESNRVVGLGAICDLGQASTDGRAQNFSVSEFALLDDDRRVILHRERGFTIGWGAGVAGGALSTSESEESITRNVLNVVLPDDDGCGEEHPWSWLADLARSRGLDVTAADLKALPYQVTLTESVKRWLGSE